MRTQKGVLPAMWVACHERLARGGWGEAPEAKGAGHTWGPGSSVLCVHGCGRRQGRASVMGQSREAPETHQ